MTFQEIQEKLKKCELALTSIKDGSYSNTNFTKEEALEKFTTIKESLEKKLNLLKEEETMFVSTKGGDTKAVQMDTKAAMDLKKDPNITGITTAKGKDLKEDDLSDEEQEEITTETSHTEVVAKEVHKALIDALQETGHEVSEDNLSSLNPETFTITVRFKDNTQSDYSFEFIADEVKLDGNIIVTTNKKGVTPILNKTIAKDNLVKYFKNLSEKKGKDLDGDGDIDSDDYKIARDRAIKANMKEEESEPVVDKKGKYTGVRRLKLSDKDKATLKKIEDLLAKEKNESINEENYDYYTKPKHFDICPGAEALRDEVLASGKTPEELGKWTFKHDELFRLEKAVLKSNKADERHVKVAKDLAGEITHHSRDLGIEANKIGYLKGHIKKIEDVANKTNGRGDNMSLRSRDIYEGEGDDHHYIKVSRRDYKKTMSILDQNVDPTYVKTEVVDDDGAGNVIIYFVFRHEYGFDDMYDDPEGKENPEFYQEPDEDPSAFVYDVVMDLQAQDIEVVDHSANLDEALDINDPALMRARVAKMRADDLRKLDAYRKSPEGRAAARAQASAERKEEKARELVRKLKIKRAEIEREMENDPDIEPEGGPVADMYGDQLNKIDNAIEKAASAYNKPMDYDTAVGKVSEEDEFAGSDPKAGSTIRGRGFDWKKDDYGRTGLDPRTFVDPEDLTPASMAKKKLNKEHISVGHPDNEPGMLKQDAYDIAHYAVKLYKLLKYYDSLEDQVDFPHWWQSKVVKARDYISKAAHYLEFKTNEPAIDSHVDALQEGRSANAIKKEYDALVKKMIELAKEYKQAEGDKKQKLVDQLKDHTKKKKELEKELEKAVEDTGRGQELDTSINELSGDQRDALIELQNILDDAARLGEEAREIIRQSFPNMLSKADAYGAFNFGSSANRYDTTLESIIEEIEEYYGEEEDLDEIGMFHDPIGYSSTAAAEDKRALQLVKDLINRGVNKEDAIEKAAEKFKLRVHYLTRYVDKHIGEAKKGELKEEMDGGRLFDYFSSKGYDVTERRPDGYPPKEGVEGYMVSRGEGRAPQSVIFQHNKDTDKFTISRMSGYRIDEKEAIKAGMREAGRSGVAGIDSYMTDGNYTPVDISAEGLKDIVDHVMTGLDREAKAQSDFYKDRGNTSGTIDEQFKVGDKVTYLGHPGVITKVNKEMTGAITYNVAYDKGQGRTKATNIYNKGGEIKALEENFEPKSQIKFFNSLKVGDKVKYNSVEKNGIKKGDEVVVDSIKSTSTFEKIITVKKGNKKVIVKATNGLKSLNENKATCCGKCGRVHVKGTKCKRPFLTGKDHCRNN